MILTPVSAPVAVAGGAVFGTAVGALTFAGGLFVSSQIGNSSAGTDEEQRINNQQKIY